MISRSNVCLSQLQRRKIGSPAVLLLLEEGFTSALQGTREASFLSAIQHNACIGINYYPSDTSPLQTLRTERPPASAGKNLSMCLGCLVNVSRGEETMGGGLDIEFQKQGITSLHIPGLYCGDVFASRVLLAFRTFLRIRRRQSSKGSLQSESP